MSDQSLTGKVALVTGGSRGFGRAIALAFAAEGVTVGVVGRSKDQLKEVCDTIEKNGGQAIAIAADITDTTSVTNAVKEMQDHFGAIGILVNGAGVSGPFGPISDVDTDAWWRTQTLHLRAPMLFMAATLSAMNEDGGGTIINIVSRAGTRLEPNLSSYSVSKAALTNLTAHVAAENKDNNIQAFALQPGDAVTEMATSTLADPEAQRWMPGMIAALTEWQENAPDPEPVLKNCGQFCVALAKGEMNERSGEYLDAESD